MSLLFLIGLMIFVGAAIGSIGIVVNRNKDWSSK